MKWLLYLVALVALLIGAAFLIGYALPAKTTASRSITLQQSAAAMEHGEEGHLLDTAAKKNTPEIYRAGEYIVDFLLELKIELVFPEDLLESLLAEVVQGAKTGKIGERKVFILEVDRAVHIRTDKERERAL